MQPEKGNVRALGLSSGGLDSILSALVLRRQGIVVSWVAFETPFFSAAKARQAARMIDVPLTVRPITAVYLEMLKNPPVGYGRHMNPCMDCHALMFRLAGEMMRAEGADFLFSGEVLGQRPMSQTRQSLRYVEKHSGFDGYIVRPLSALRLPETIPEREGWVERAGLLGIAGRGRKEQIRLAREFGVTDYPAPAGGCLLTDKNYSRRLRDLLAQRDLPAERELELLKYGRHFRLDPDTKVVVGRSQAENEAILACCDPAVDIRVKIRDYPGPLALVPHGGNPAAVMLAATICAGYSKAPKMVQAVAADVVRPGGREVLQVIALPPADFKRLLI
ncbi:MAG TPA: tRNA 4-thiouridine(8) synthase ThiI [Desulfobacterales bacterium]|nr:tRNA 4-thiouridine(8) synthase ThiI [Desulfobacterales bacterium]